MFGIFKMSEGKKAILAHQNWASFRDLNDSQIRKYSSMPITPLRLSFTKQKIVLLLDALYKLASLSGEIKYKDISGNKALYEILGTYFNTVLENESHFPPYEQFKEHSDSITNELYKYLVGPDDTFRNKIHG